MEQNLYFYPYNHVFDTKDEEIWIIMTIFRKKEIAYYQYCNHRLSSLLY